MDYEFITYDQTDRVVTITFNRPERLNAIHPPATAELVDAWARFKADDDAWVAILTGAGRAFSAGNDLKHTAATGETSASGLLKGGGGAITRDFECWKPMIAAVHGYALGLGLEMALACDIIICAEGARLGLPEPTVGLMAAAGGVQRLPRQIPPRIAMGYILTARYMPAEEALRWGLVNELVPPDDLLPAARRWADEIIACAPLSIRASKEAAYRGQDMPLITAIEHLSHNVRVMWQSQDAIEGPRAFAEGRAPVWQGR